MSPSDVTLLTREPRLAARGSESTVTITSGRVTKTLTQRGLTMNSEYNRTPEVEWYRRRPIPMMPKLIRASDHELVIEYAGEPLNERQRYRGLAAWVEKVRAALKAAGVHHRDIHTGNVLHHAGRYALIDWTWATTDPTSPCGTRWRDDDKSLDLIAALDADR